MFYQWRCLCYNTFPCQWRCPFTILLFISRDASITNLFHNNGDWRCLCSLLVEMPVLQMLQCYSFLVEMTVSLLCSHVQSQRTPCLITHRTRLRVSSRLMMCDQSFTFTFLIIPEDLVPPSYCRPTRIRVWETVGILYSGYVKWRSY